MSNKMKQAFENIKELSLHERAVLAHCLIVSLDEVNDDGVDEAWAEVAKVRYAELASGEVKAVTWDEIKQGIKR